MMLAIRYIRIDGPAEAYTVLAGRRHKDLGIVVRRDDGRWDANAPGATLRTAIVRSRADAVAALMDHAGIE